MKAIGFRTYGSPDGVELRDIPIPVPKDNELLVRVHASSVNSWDWEFLNGKPFANRLMFGLLKPRKSKQILGADIAGTVETVGRRVTRFRPGDSVFGDMWDNFGGFAEYACARETALERMPGNASFEEAAAIPQAGVLALQALLKAGPMQPGQKVLINGAGGGVGTFAIQLAKLNEADVTGVDAAHKLDVIRALGADQVMDYSTLDFARTGNRYDQIIDCQNTRSIAELKRALTSRGTYALVGGTRVFPIFFRHFTASLWRGGQRFRVVMDGPNKGLKDLASLMEAGRLAPVIDRSFDLHQVPEAMRYFGEGLHKGKISVRVAGPGPVRT